MLSLLGISYLKSSLKLSHESCTQCHVVIVVPSSHYIYEIVWINVVKLYWFGFSPFNSQRPSWSWSYGSWIYNYVYIQCLSALNLWVRIPLMTVCTRYNIMWYSVSVTCYRSVVFSWYSGFLTNKTNLYDISEILLKMTLNAIKHSPTERIIKCCLIVQG